MNTVDPELQSLLSHCIETGILDHYESETGGFHLVQYGVHLHIPNAHVKRFLEYSLQPKPDFGDGQWLLVPKEDKAEDGRRPSRGDNMA